MEMMALVVLVLALAVAVLGLWLRLRRQRADVEAYAEHIDRALDDLLAEGPRDARIAATDDLWGHTNERLLRLSQAQMRRIEALQREQRSLQGLVADISHQTKTPLANIQLYLERLEQGAEDASLVAKLGAQVEKLDFLLANMVKISRLETGAVRIQKQQALLADTLADALSVIVPKADAKQIRLSVDYDETMTLNHDRRWTAEALANLLDNAVKYSDEDSDVTVSVHRENAYAVVISVSDHGTGISDEEKEKVFDMFYTGGSRSSDSRRSLGLGLALCRSIITSHGGTISVSDNIPNGTVVSFTLPIGEVDLNE